jgi:hypothetical protein
MPLLPFLSNKIKRKETGIAIQTRSPDSHDEPEAESDDKGSSALHAAAQDILRAISDNDSQHLALALKAAYEICESYPAQDESEPSEMEQE